MKNQIFKINMHVLLREKLLTSKRCLVITFVLPLITLSWSLQAYGGYWQTCNSVANSIAKNGFNMYGWMSPNNNNISNVINTSQKAVMSYNSGLCIINATIQINYNYTQSGLCGFYLNTTNNTQGTAAVCDTTTNPGIIANEINN